MRVLTNTTSPYARLVRIALAEKGLGQTDEVVVSPWNDDAALMRVNPAARVPVVETEEERHLTESLLIIMRLERSHPEPSLLSGDEDMIFAQAGIALGVIDAAVHTLLGRLVTDGALTATGFDGAPVGLRRRRTMLDGLGVLEQAPPVWDGYVPSLAVIAAVVALDYVAFRFGAAPWHRPHPALEGLAAGVGARPSFAATRPYA